MRAKLSVLRACRRVLKPGGQMAFFTIYIPLGLSERDYRRAARARAPGITSWRRTQAELLETAGFADIEEVDVTEQYLETTEAWMNARIRHREELGRALGKTNEDAIKEGRRSIAAIREGLVRRSLLFARRP